MKKNSAFSLIELSIVILIIGILIAGITQSSRLVKQFRIKSAQTLTQSSPVNGIEDLAVWFEPTMEKSFADSETQNNSTITNWYDINSNSSIKNNATQATATNRPTYVDNAIGGLPAIRFDGVDNFMTFDASMIVDVSYTIFAVEQRRGNASSINHFLGGSTSGIYNNLHLGYDSSTVLRFGHYSYDLDYTVPSYSTPIPRMHSFRFSKTGGKSYWLNGGVSPDAIDASQTIALESNGGSALGRAVFGSGFYFNGDIAELIIFTRDLRTEERQAVETYLGKKYSIKIS